jgi:hypothetical protein
MLAELETAPALHGAGACVAAADVRPGGAERAAAVRLAPIRRLDEASAPKRPVICPQLNHEDVPA